MFCAELSIEYFILTSSNPNYCLHLMKNSLGEDDLTNLTLSGKCEFLNPEVIE